MGVVEIGNTFPIPKYENIEFTEDGIVDYYLNSRGS
jgi:hypothetical protein